MENKTIRDRQNKNKSEFVEQLKKTPIIELTCKKVGVSRSTFYRWRKNSKKFARQIEQALDEGVSMVSDLAESKLISAIQDDNLTATMFWLKSKNPAYKNKIELSTKDEPQEKLSAEQNKIVTKALLMGPLTEEKDDKKNQQSNDQQETVAE